MAAILAFDEIARRSAQRRAFIRTAIRSGNAWVLLANAVVIGYLVLEYTFYSHGFISMLYVHPEYRRMGIGVALLRYAESICQTEKLFTSTNQSNRPMKALLAEMNFKPTGRIENLDDGDPELVFFKTIGENEPVKRLRRARVQKSVKKDR